MAEVKPLKGLLYDGSRIGGDYACVMAPPYDVIPDSMRDELYGKSEYNVVRLILGKSFEGDTVADNKYTRAKLFLDRWRQEGVLKKDETGAFYVYLQEYNHGETRHRRVGFMGLMKLNPSGRDEVLPHEYTLKKPKEDRLNLMKEVKGNLSPVFVLYDDGDRQIKETLENGMSASEAVIDICIDGIRHALWRVSDNPSLEKIVTGMSGRKTFIADGHHRYAVAGLYRDTEHEKKGSLPDADYVMTYFTDLAEGDNLTVMATHRVIKTMPVAGEDNISAGLSRYFNVTECDGLPGLMKRLEDCAGKAHVFGFFGGTKYLFAEPKDEAALLGLVKENKSDVWKNLDVSVLHSAVFDGILSLGNIEGNITYVRDPETGEALVKDGSHAAAFFLNPTRVEQLKAVAELGEMMPQKSTYFYPKLLTGLVMNVFQDT